MLYCSCLRSKQEQFLDPKKVVNCYYPHLKLELSLSNALLQHHGLVCDK